jgi:hypothetical protein
MTILPLGNIGINNTNPSQIFQVGNAGRLRISNGSDDYSLLGTIDTDGGTNSRIVISGNTRTGGNAGNIDYNATSTGAHIFKTTNSGNEIMRITGVGNVGIGLANPQFKLHITAGKTIASTAYAMKVSGGAIQDTGNYGTLIGITSEDVGWCKNAIGHVRTGNYDG